MPVKDTEMVARRVDLAKNLSAGIDAYAAEVAVGHADYLAPALGEGETVFDTRQQLVLMSRRATQHRQTLESLDDGVLVQTHLTDNVRFSIEKLMGVVDGKLRAIRHTVRGAFGPAGVRRVGLAGRFPAKASGLYRRARLVQMSLRQPGLALDPVLDSPGDEPTITPSVLADKLEPELSQLGGFVDSRHAEIRVDDGVRSRRREAVAEFDRGISAIVLIVKGILRAAGRDDLVARFRSTLRRAGHRTPVEPSPGEGTPPPTEPVDSTPDTPASP